jgi:hypothetical protein
MEAAVGEATLRHAQGGLPPLELVGGFRLGVGMLRSNSFQTQTDCFAMLAMTRQGGGGTPPYMSGVVKLREDFS